VYDIFWVFFSEQFFGANVMVSVATQQASNPAHTVANSLNLPGLQSISKKLELPVKLVFPRSLLGGPVGGGSRAEFMMLGLGDMAIPGMLLALVLCFDYRRNRELGNDTKLPVMRGCKYVWHALSGYTTGLIAALAAGILTRLPQPALLYLVPSTLGPVIFIAWIRSELKELWNGPRPVLIFEVPTDASKHRWQVSSE
jgi:signal peptide peptidase-like protein 3